VATSTMNTMLPVLARLMGVYRGTYATTTNIAGSSQVLISTNLGNDGYDQDDTLNGWWIRFLGANNLDKIRYIGDYTGSSSTITVKGANLASESGSTNFELYEGIDPNRLLDALSDAVGPAHPLLYSTQINEVTTTAAGQSLYARPSTIPAGYVREISYIPRLSAKTFANNIARASNVDMEDGTIATDWTAESGITISIESSTDSPNNFAVLAGTQSMKLDVTAADKTVRLSIADPTNYAGEELNFSIWVYSRTADIIKALIQTDSDTIAEGSFHTGNGWEKLTATTVAENVGTSIKIGLHCDNDSGSQFVAYADEAILTAGQSELPSPEPMPLLHWKEEGDNIRISEPMRSGHNFQIKGMGYLTALTSTGTSTTEVDTGNQRLLAAFAAREKHMGDIETVDEADQTTASRATARWERIIESGEGAMAGMPMYRSDV
jgi:hypothetical protein